MTVIKECEGYKLMFDSINIESTIVNSDLNYYGEIKRGEEARDEVNEVLKMSDLAFVTYSVSQMRDKYQIKD